jgi:hypothetical protein
LHIVLSTDGVRDPGERDAVHKEPIWHERANFIIAAHMPEGNAEQLWARQIGDNRFEICCIPFFVYNLALGDVVLTNSDHEVAVVVEQSGRFVFRVWFGESFHRRQDVAEELADLGALLEWSSPNLLAVDAANAEQAKTIADYLAQAERAGRLTYETGRRSPEDRADFIFT